MDSLIRTLILDDDPASVEILTEGLKKHSDIQIVGTADNLNKGIELIREEKPDIIFLDIEFPEENAMPLAERLQASGNIRIIFYSSYRKYLVKALRLRAFDFLLKPFDANELELILHRYRLEKQEEERVVPQCYYTLPPAPESNSSRYIAVTTITNDKEIVSSNAIVYFRYDNQRKLWEVVLNNLERYILKRHTTADTILNYGPGFVRTHKAFIVNIAYIGRITQTECRLIPPLDDITEIKISKNYRRDLLDRFYDI